MSLTVEKLEEMYKLTLQRHKEERTGIMATFSILVIAVLFAFFAQWFGVNKYVTGLIFS